MDNYNYGKRRVNNDCPDNVQDEEETENQVRNRNAQLTTFKRLDSIQDPGKRYALKDCIGKGVCGDVYEGIDQQTGMWRENIQINVLTRTFYINTAREGGKKVAATED